MYVSMVEMAQDLRRHSRHDGRPLSCVPGGIQIAPAGGVKKREIA